MPFSTDTKNKSSFYPLAIRYAHVEKIISSTYYQYVPRGGACGVTLYAIILLQSSIFFPVIRVSCAMF
jgi:hypothetical protein